MPDHFLTLAAPSVAEPPKIKGSRFLADALSVADEAAALAVVADVKKREHAARHHVWAFRLGPEGTHWRANDDGEPHGTGGRPVLQEIEGRDLTDLVVVVTRYYGGTKLGAGGLARAYGGAAAAALDAARVRRVTVRQPVVLRFAFADTSAAMRTLDAFDATVLDQTYTPEGTALRLGVRQSQVGALTDAFREATSGRGGVEPV